MIKDKDRLPFHPFTPRLLKRAAIRRKEESKYPNRLKNKVTKTIVPKKSTHCFAALGVSTAAGFSCIALVSRKSRSKKRPDKNTSNSPRIRGNKPVPAIRKFPMGILKERRAVAAPKSKRTIPPATSSFFNFAAPANRPQLIDF